MRSTGTGPPVTASRLHTCANRHKCGVGERESYLSCRELHRLLGKPILGSRLEGYVHLCNAIVSIVPYGITPKSSIVKSTNNEVQGQEKETSKEENDEGYDHD